LAAPVLRTAAISGSRHGKNGACHQKQKSARTQIGESRRSSSIGHGKLMDSPFILNAMDSGYLMSRLRKINNTKRSSAPESGGDSLDCGWIEEREV